MKIKSVNAAPTLAAVIFLLLLGSGFIDPALFGDTNPYLSVIILELLIFALPALCFCRLRGEGYSRAIRFRLFEPGCLPFILLAAAALMLVSCAIKLGIYALFDYSLEITDIYESYAPDAGYGENVMFSALAFAVFPAITEELVFRGIMLAEYEDCGIPAAVVYSSLLFTMLHFDLKLFPVYFVSGVILAITAYACRSILAAMAVHALNNVFSLFFEDYIWNSILQPRNIVVFAFIVISLSLLALSLMFGEAGRLYKNYGIQGERSDYVKPKSERTPPVFAVMTIPFAACLLIYILAVLLPQAI